MGETRRLVTPIEPTRPVASEVISEQWNICRTPRLVASGPLLA
jgi:hypothetical protein